jgi:hypothetical protein
MSESENITNTYLNNLKATLSRFILPIFCTILIAIIDIMNFLILNNKILDSIAFILTIGVNLLTALKLYAENNKWNNGKYFIISIIALIIIFIIRLDIYYRDIAMEDIVTFSIMHFAFFVSISFAPFINHKDNNIDYCNFSCNISSAILLSLIVATILAIGISSILLTISFLLNIKISKDIYIVFATICYKVFYPLYFLSRINKNFSLAKEIYSYKSIKFITNYILTPITLIYLTTLYLYIIKIIITQQSPKNFLLSIVSCIIILFCSLGILNYLFAYPLFQNQKNRFMALFLKYFFHLLILPLIFLFVIMYQRINQFGITEGRYFILALGFWISICCLNQFFTKEKSLKFIAISLSIILIFSSFGPWGMFYVSKISQVNRLKSILESRSADQKSSYEIKKITEYLLKHK